MYTFNILVRRTGTCRRSIGEHTVYHVHQAFNPFQIFSFLFQLSNKETFSSGTVEFSDKCLDVCALRTVINYTRTCSYMPCLTGQWLFIKQYLSCGVNTCTYMCTICNTTCTLKHTVYVAFTLGCSCDATGQLEQH